RGFTSGTVVAGTPSWVAERLFEGRESVPLPAIVRIVPSRSTRRTRPLNVSPMIRRPAEATVIHGAISRAGVAGPLSFGRPLPGIQENALSPSPAKAVTMPAALTFQTRARSPEPI